MARILIVDDNRDVAFMVKEKLLYFFGEDIEIANSGQECLDAVRQAPPDLILLDINMPIIDGFEVCRLLKQDPSTRQIPVIFLSATYDDLRSKVKGLELGADDYMVQPVDDLELVVRVRTLLELKELRTELNRLKSQLNRTKTDWDSVHRRTRSAAEAILELCQHHDRKDDTNFSIDPGSISLIRQHAQDLISIADHFLDKSQASP